MTNISEDYVSFETAKLLKEKGFDEKCQKVYMYNGQLLWAQIFMEGESFVNNKCINLVANYNNWITHTQGEYAYLCPTLQMAMKWLRKEHNIFISIVFCTYPSLNKVTWTPEINTFDSVFPESAIEYDSYEEATEAAIKYCLENLI